MPMRAAIDFAALAAVLLANAATLVPQWLPGGRRRGAEYVCASLAGGVGESFSVNLLTGRWADFANEAHRGGDLISLFAAINGLTQAEAAQRLNREMGLSAPVAAPRAAMPASKPRRTTLWRAVVPVPVGAPPATFEHWHYERPEATWAYRHDGQLLGHVARFTKRDGGKEILPLTWCVDQSDDRGTRRWHWKQWDEPRPLYLPAGALSPPESGRIVVVVEGEKCAHAGYKLPVAEFDFVSWPGGCRAWSKAKWSWIVGRIVVLWPDADAKRVPLTAAERADGLNPDSKPFLPVHRQPGLLAMRELGACLMSQHRCKVSICAVSAPGNVADGWDIADAIGEGWDAARVRAFILSAEPLTPDHDARSAARQAEASTVPEDDAGAPDEPGAGTTRRGWKAELQRAASGAIKTVRENVVLALDGRRGIPGVPELKDLIAFNELTNDVVKLREPPWGGAAGIWSEVDELLMGEWLLEHHGLPSMSRQTLEEAVKMVATRHAFHPVRQFVRALRWDGVPRLKTWLARACLEEDEWDENDPLQRYLALVGTYYLMGMVARVLEPRSENGITVRGPGTKFDYLLVLESPEQGRGKSSLFKVLGGEWFADTGLNLDNKDSYQQLQGPWIYELPELHSLAGVDINKVKAFIASSCDFFRASFDRRARAYPRQVIFGATTNEVAEYLNDPTGNRRIWPVRVTRLIDLEGVSADREQLFAEAVARVDAGHRIYPSPEEEAELFVPQQNARMVVSSIGSKIEVVLNSATADDGAPIQKSSVVDLLERIGIALERLGPNRFHEKQAVAALRRLGWTQDGRRDPASNARYWYRPPGAVPGASPTKRPTQGDTPARPDRGCPF